jgi:hypothetical protein
MNTLEAILQNTLDTECAPNLQEDVKSDVDIIIDGTRKAWAPFKATVASLVAKLKYPEWDTRIHQVQIGGKYSLRSIDASVVAPFLHSRGLYDTATPFALTRSFEKSEPFDANYSGKIQPAACKPAFIKIQKIINTSADVQLLHDILVYMFLWLKSRKNESSRLKNTVIETQKSLNFRDVWSMCEYVSSLGMGSSVVPVIMVHSVLTVALPDASVKPLKEHTAPDNHSKARGDVEGFIDSRPVIAVEVKHQIKVDDTIIRTFAEKTEGVPSKFIVTTACTSLSITDSNIWIYSLNHFVPTILQNAVIRENDVCTTFVKKFREAVLNYSNLSLELKETINNYITALFVETSP